jgi:hypothetical protein
MVSRRVSSAALVLLTIVGCSSLAAFQRYSKQEGDRFQSKLTRIVVFGNTQAAVGRRASQNTDISDDELNSYLRFNVRDQLPEGIVEPTLNALGDGKVSGRVTVDLDAVRKQKQRGWMDPMNLLSGSLPVTARGTLSTKDGMGRFELESAEISGVAVPKALIQELLTYYSKSSEHPNGINMDDPFELPSRIREIRVGKAQSTIVQ